MFIITFIYITLTGLYLSRTKSQKYGQQSFIYLPKQPDIDKLKEQAPSKSQVSNVIPFNRKK